MGIFNNIFSVKKNKDYKLSKTNSKSLKNDNYNKDIKKVDDVQYENVDYSNNGYNYIEGFIRNFDTNAMLEMYEKEGATVVNGATSIFEGFVQFGEALLDAGATVTSTIGTALWDGSGYLLDAVGLDEAAEVAHGYAEEERRVLQDFVAEERTKNSFDVIYNETNFGKWVMDNSYGAEVVRSFGNGVGYTIGALVCCYVTCGAISPVALGVTGGVGGVGKGTQEAWSNGASYGEGLAYGVATGAWEGLQFWAGGKINTLSPFEKTLSNVGLRIALDTVDGAAEGFVQPALQTIYQKGYVDPKTGEYIEFNEDTSFVDRYMGMWTQQGGWSAVAMNAAIALSMSTLGEVGQYAFRRSPQLTELDSINSKAQKNIELTAAELEKIEIARTQLGLSESATIEDITSKVNRIFKSLDYDKVDLKNMDLSTMRKLNESVYLLEPNVKKDILSVISGTKSLKDVKYSGHLDFVMENYLNSLTKEDIINMNDMYKNVLKEYMIKDLKKDGYQLDTKIMNDALFEEYAKIKNLDEKMELPDLDKTMELPNLDKTMELPNLNNLTNLQNLEPSESVSYLSELRNLSESEIAIYEVQINNLAAKYNVSPIEMKQILDDKMIELISDSPFGCRKSFRSLERSLDEGSFKTIFETGGKSSGLGGDEGLMRRGNFEPIFFHRPQDIAVEETPLSGTLLPSSIDDIDMYISDGPGNFYGRGAGNITQAMVIFDKEKVLKDTTFTIGDSLIYGDGKDIKRVIAPSLASEPEFRGGFFGFTNGIDDIESLKKCSFLDLFSRQDNLTYCEIQLHGSTAKSVDNIAAVVFSSEPPVSLKIKLQEKGIPYRVINEVNWRN